MEAQYTMEEYNRIFDRAAEDALTDQLQEEYWDGSLKIASSMSFPISGSTVLTCSL